MTNDRTLPNSATFVERLRKRAEIARKEENVTAQCDADYFEKSADRIQVLTRKLEEIHDITQDTTLGMECWQKLQNIAATASSALQPQDEANG